MRRDISQHWRDSMVQDADAHNAAMRPLVPTGALPHASQLVRPDEGYTQDVPRDAGNRPAYPYRLDTPPATANRYELREDSPTVDNILTVPPLPGRGDSPAYSMFRRATLTADLVQRSAAGKYSIPQSPRAPSPSFPPDRGPAHQLVDLHSIVAGVTKYGNNDWPQDGGQGMSQDLVP